MNWLQRQRVCILFFFFYACLIGWGVKGTAHPEMRSQHLGLQMTGKDRLHVLFFFYPRLAFLCTIVVCFKRKDVVQVLFTDWCICGHKNECMDKYWWCLWTPCPSMLASKITYCIWQCVKVKKKENTERFILSFPSLPLCPSLLLCTICMMLCIQSEGVLSVLHCDGGSLCVRVCVLMCVCMCS